MTPPPTTIAAPMTDDRPIPPAATPRPREPRVGDILITGLLWCVVFLSLLKLPAGASSGLDPSWRMVIGHAVGRGFQWGHDIVFTYGPLGYLLASTNHGEHYNHFLVWQLLSNLVFATVIVLFGRRFTGWRAFAFYAYFLAFVANYLDAMHMTMVVLLVLTALRQAPGARRWLVALAGALLAVLSLVKFTNLMLAGFGMACIAAHHAWRRRWTDLAIAVGSFGGAFLLGWILCGQNPLNLPAYVLTSLDASGGYSEGMSVYEETRVFALGLACAVAVAIYYVLSLWKRADLPLALATMLVAAAASFMNWKHGFSRADGHVFAHFISCLLIAVTFPVLLADDGPWRRLKAGLLAVAAATALTGTLISTPTAITDAPAIWNYNLKGIVNALRILPDLRRNADQEFKTIAGPHYLHNIRHEVGTATVDMIGNEQAYLLFNRFNYRPRPVFQSYLPYTEKLLRLNAEFLRSDRAPEFIIHKLDTIDFRFPLQEDSLAIRELFYRYEFVLEERTMLLWRKRAGPVESPTPKLLSRTRVGFGEPVQIPSSSDHAVWAEITVRPSLLGRLRNFLYKAPIITLPVTDGGGFTQNYRLIRRMASAGFLVYPYFTSGYNIQRYMAGDPPPRADRFSVEVPEAQRKYFQAAIDVAFFSLPPVPRHAGIARSAPDSTFHMFDRVPDSVYALYPANALEIDGHKVLHAHPPSNLEFKVDFPAERVRGSFGISRAAHTAPNMTDGCEFFVEWTDASGKVTTLFSRHLQPGRSEDDRGLQDFDVAIPPGGGRLILRITPGPAGDIVCDWAYWTDLRFTPRPPAQP